MASNQQPDLLDITPAIQNESQLESQLGLEIVKQSSFLNQFENDVEQPNIENLIGSTLKEIIPSKDENTALILGLFPQDGDLPVKEALARASKDQLAQAVAFPNSNLLEQFLLNYDDENNFIELNVPLLASLATSCENVQSDDFLNRYIEDLKDYKSSSKPKNLNLPSNSKTQMEKIRGNVLRNIDFF